MQPAEDGALHESMQGKAPVRGCPRTAGDVTPRLGRPRPLEPVGLRAAVAMCLELLLVIDVEGPAVGHERLRNLERHRMQPEYQAAMGQQVQRDLDDAQRQGTPIELPILLGRLVLRLLDDAADEPDDPHRGGLDLRRLGQHIRFDGVAHHRQVPEHFLLQRPTQRAGHDVAERDGDLFDPAAEILRQFQLQPPAVLAQPFFDDLALRQRCLALVAFSIGAEHRGDDRVLALAGRVAQPPCQRGLDPGHDRIDRDAGSPGIVRGRGLAGRRAEDRQQEAVAAQLLEKKCEILIDGFGRRRWHAFDAEPLARLFRLAVLREEACRIRRRVGRLDVSCRDHRQPADQSRQLADRAVCNLVVAHRLFEDRAPQLLHADHQRKISLADAELVALCPNDARARRDGQRDFREILDDGGGCQRALENVEEDLIRPIAAFGGLLRLVAGRVVGRAARQGHPQPAQDGLHLVVLLLGLCVCGQVLQLQRRKPGPFVPEPAFQFGLRLCL